MTQNQLGHQLGEQDEGAAVRTAFDALLAADQGDAGPDIGAILAGGRRRRRRRTLTLVGGACAAIVAVTAGLGVARTAARPAGPQTPPFPAGEASSPALPPHDLSQPHEQSVHASLLAALRRHLPAGTSISEGSGPTGFVLTHPDGTETSISAEVGLQNLTGLPNPCSTSHYASACRRVILPDGSRGWASVINGGRGLGGVVDVTATTVDGQVFGLADGNIGPLAGPHQLPDGTGIPLSQQQLIALVEQPDVLVVLKTVPTDEPVPATPGVPHKV